MGLKYPKTSSQRVVKRAIDKRERREKRDLHFEKRERERERERQ
jgi:hypothetical protein